MSEEEYRKIVDKMRAWYKAVHTVYCPCLQADVVFNAKGFYHVFYDGNGVRRSKDERIRRLMLLPHVVSIVQSAKRVVWEQKIGGVEWLVLRGQIRKEDGGCAWTRVVIRRSALKNYFYHSVMDE